VFANGLSCPQSQEAPKSTTDKAIIILAFAGIVTVSFILI
jgi:hypothetical protein